VTAFGDALLVLLAVGLVAAAAVRNVSSGREALSGRNLSLVAVTFTVLVPALFFLADGDDPDVPSWVLADVRRLHLLGAILFACAQLATGRARRRAGLVPRRGPALLLHGLTVALVLYGAVFFATTESPLAFVLRGDLAGAVSARLALTHGYTADAYPFLMRYWGLVFYSFLGPLLVVLAVRGYRERRWFLLSLAFAGLFLVLLAALEKANLLKFMILAYAVVAFGRGRAVGYRDLTKLTVLGLAIAVPLQFLLVNFGEQSLWHSIAATFERIFVLQTKSSQYAYALFHDGLPSGLSFVDFGPFNGPLGFRREAFQAFKLEVFALTTKHEGDDLVGSAGGYGLVHLYLQFGWAALPAYLLAAIGFLSIDDRLCTLARAPEARAVYLWWALSVALIPVTGFEYFFSPVTLFSPGIAGMLVSFALFFHRDPSGRRAPLPHLAPEPYSP